MSDREQLAAIGQTDLARTRLEQEIALRLREMGDVELGILRTVQGRLIMGQVQYGKFQPKELNRNLAREALEEVQDALVYTAKMLVEVGG